MTDFESHVKLLMTDAHCIQKEDSPASTRGSYPSIDVRKGARDSRVRERRYGAATLCGALCLLVRTCSAFSVAGGSFVQPQRLVEQRTGVGFLARSAAPSLRSCDLSIANNLMCAVAVSVSPPNSIFSSGDWGLLLPAAEQPKRPALPRLTTSELKTLLGGRRVQRQSRVGPVGHGLVVMDVNADIATVMAVLSDVQRYPQRISTVREAVMHPGGSRNLCKTRFKLSRFKLDVQVELFLSKARNMLEFRLDKTSGRMQGAVFDEARGYWYLEPCPERDDGWTRVWLNARVQCSPLLPSAVIDYAATKALPRATTWLAPVCEAVQLELASKGAVSKNVHSL